MAEGRRSLAVIGLILLALLSIPIAGQNSNKQERMDPEVQPPIRTNGFVHLTTPVGLTPAQVRRAYGFDQIPNRGAGQTIAIVDAYDQLYAEEDLAVFNQTFSLPPCTTANGCFRKLFTTKNRPPTHKVWALEISLDIEWAHAIAPDAKILLVEAKSSRLSDLMEAIRLAIQNGATVVSMSWGAPEFLNEFSYEPNFQAVNVTFVAASGDFGTGTFYPAASPNVLGVGGTTLTVDALGNYISELGFSGSGGGVSPLQAQPLYQAQYGLPNNPDKRGVPDVAYNADFASGFAVYSTFPYFGLRGWIDVGGTSAGAPQWAGLVAVANSMRVAASKPIFTGVNAALYRIAKASGGAEFHDILAGSNGTCGLVCTAMPGFDYVTGLGSPRAQLLVNALASQP
jgi:subtilase family serine protease